MKLLMCGLAVSTGIVANGAMAEVTVNVDGADVPLSTLMDNCTGITGDAQAKLSCFNALTQLLDEQSGTVADDAVSVTDALNDLRTVAQYQDSESGLSIAGTACSIQIVYFNNYYHLSRRNVSTIDLFSAAFDASKIQYDQIAEVPGAQAPLFRGVMDVGVTAAMHGGVALESTEYNFAPKSARTAIDAYAHEVVDQLSTREGQTFDFVLVHPKLQSASTDIWTAFEAYVNACKE